MTDTKTQTTNWFQKWATLSDRNLKIAISLMWFGFGVVVVAMTSATAYAIYWLWKGTVWYAGRI